MKLILLLFKVNSPSLGQGFFPWNRASCGWPQIHCAAKDNLFSISRILGLQVCHHGQF